MPKLNKRRELERIAKEIASCKVCRRNKIGIPVAGAGNPDANVVLIGEAPGRKESVAGQPFIGSAGRILRQTLEHAGIPFKDVFITSPVKYLPKHGTPTPIEVKHGMKHTWEQMKAIKPKIILLMGRVACLGFLERSCQVSLEHGKIVEQNGFTFLITYHPAAPLYSPKVKKELLRDFKRLKNFI